jgi:hypothetical protein
MGGTSTQTGKSEQTSQLTPWDQTSGRIQGILGGLDPTIANLSGSPDMTAAYNQLEANANAPNPLGSLALGAGASLLGGGANYGKATGILGDAYGRTTAALSPYVSGSPFDPTSNPALAQQLATVNQDALNSVGGMFAAAGRLGSPDYYQAAARGIAQGSAPILQNAASNYLNAVGMLGSAAGNTASGLIGADSANASLLGQGINSAATAYGTQNLGPQALLAAATGREQVPLQNASALMGILGPLAAQFGKQTGDSTSSQENTMSGAQQAWGWMNSVANLVKAFKGGGGTSETSSV